MLCLWPRSIRYWAFHSSCQHWYCHLILCSFVRTPSSSSILASCPLLSIDSSSTLFFTSWAERECSSWHLGLFKQPEKKKEVDENFLLTCGRSRSQWRRRQVAGNTAQVARRATSQRWQNSTTTCNMWMWYVGNIWIHGYADMRQRTLGCRIQHLIRNCTEPTWIQSIWMSIVQQMVLVRTAVAY